MKKSLHLIFVFMLSGFGAFSQAVPELIYYKFDSPGTTVQNQASNPVGTNPATITGATIGGTGQFGTAMVGNGGSGAANAVNTGWNPNLGTGDWTISAWFNNIPSSTTVRYLFGLTGAGFRCFTGGAAGAGAIRITDGGITAFNVPNVFDGTPVVIHYVHDDTAGEVKFYVNGTLTFTSSQPNVNLTGATALLVGASLGTGLPTGGLMDEFRIYNRALPVTEIASTWNQTLPFATTANDIELTAITSPGSMCGLSNAEPVTITVRNIGSAAQRKIPVSYTLNSAIPVTDTIPGLLAPGAIASFTFATRANMSAPGIYTLVATVNLPGDTNPVNNSLTKTVTNAMLAGIPAFDFETTASGVAGMRTVANAQSGITEGAGASFGAGSTKGMIMDGGTLTTWTMPTGSADPWTMNPAHLAVSSFCFSPAGGSANDSLWLTFDLKQLYKTANANTNFRVKVNGAQVGATYRPPFAGSGNWQKIKVDLTTYKNLPSIDIDLESSVAEPYANGNGPANLVDNINVVNRIVLGTRNAFSQKNLTVFPNPSRGMFTVELPDANAYTLEVTDLTGKVIKTQKAVSGKNMLDLNDSAKGVYLLKVSSKNGIAFKKLIIE
ncbi:LamG-like jellyroll fold domain-containing protein [Adhaeribacter soli]|uniref:T9SS type A sorting domain-containing protein n=1 Tax=Adhaeribacter soli TaxID=2607655 RepID=A0A5N1J2E1_9BACT|nr:LamG-like jellyroll fold domain-containing protein [Adhaeribacter soli]KAA9340933.1 T9SS type A sorting domain-containing protein [Adhaeribacter soli]